LRPSRLAGRGRLAAGALELGHGEQAVEHLPMKPNGTWPPRQRLTFESFAADSAHRSEIRSRSNSANTTMICATMRPAAVSKSNDSAMDTMVLPWS
jgi:hypothetical protein